MPSGAYLAGFAGWVLAWGGVGWVLVRARQRRRRAGRSLRVVDPLLGLWCLLGLLTLPEAWFAFVYDATDSFSQTNVSQKWFARHVRANRAGYRDDRELPSRREPGVVYVGFVGDSFTFGHGIRRTQDRFSDRVGEQLEAAYPGRVRVFNAALPGVEIRALVEQLVPELLGQGTPLDVLVYVFVPNDIEYLDARTARFYQELQGQTPRFVLWRDTYFYNWLALRVGGLWSRGGGDYYGYLAEAYSGPPWPRFQACLEQLRNLCAEQGVVLRVVVFPFLSRLGPEDPFAPAYARVRAACHELGIPCLDLQPVLVRHAHQRLMVSPFDAHPNELAHRLAADAIGPDLIEALAPWLNSAHVPTDPP